MEDAEDPVGVFGQILGRVLAVCGGERGVGIGEDSTMARWVAASMSSFQRLPPNDDVDEVESKVD